MFACLVGTVSHFLFTYKEYNTVCSRTEVSLHLTPSLTRQTCFHAASLAPLCPIDDITVIAW